MTSEMSLLDSQTTNSLDSGIQESQTSSSTAELAYKLLSNMTSAALEVTSTIMSELMTTAPPVTSSTRKLGTLTSLMSRTSPLVASSSIQPTSDRLSNPWTSHPPSLSSLGYPTPSTRNPLPSTSSNPALLTLICLPIISILANLLLSLSIKLDRHLHFMTYYFFLSLSVMHLLLSLSLMPPAIQTLLAGEFIYSEEMCKLWTTFDLFFCNNTCLHLAFINMDAFLRLKDPLRHGRIITTCSLTLWIGAPWVISFVQGIAQYMLSQGDHNIIKNGVCFIGDKNFVILGTIFSFVIPTVIAVLFYCLCTYEIKALKAGKLLQEAGQEAFRYDSQESLREEDEAASDSTSCVSEVEVLPQDQVQLALVTENGVANNNKVGTNPDSKPSTNEQTTTFCDVQAESNQMKSANDISNFVEHLASADQSTSCTLLLRDSTTRRQHHEVTNAYQNFPESDIDHRSPDEGLRIEQAISRLMFVLLVCYLVLWIPLVVSNVVYGICSSCRYSMVFVEISIFKWLAYSTALLPPFLFAAFSEPIRQAYWKCLTFQSCKERNRLR